MAGSLELAESLRAIDDAHEVARGRRPTRLVFGSEQVEIAVPPDVNALLSALAPCTRSDSARSRRRLESATTRHGSSARATITLSR